MQRFPKIIKKPFMNIESRSKGVPSGHEKLGKVEREIVMLGKVREIQFV